MMKEMRQISRHRSAIVCYSYQLDSQKPSILDRLNATTPNASAIQMFDLGVAPISDTLIDHILLDWSDITRKSTSIRTRALTYVLQNKPHQAHTAP